MLCCVYDGLYGLILFCLDVGRYACTKHSVYTISLNDFVATKFYRTFHFSFGSNRTHIDRTFNLTIIFLNAWNHNNNNSREVMGLLLMSISLYLSLSLSLPLIHGFDFMSLLQMLNVQGSHNVQLSRCGW